MSSELSSISFRDEQFLVSEGLSSRNVMEYFYQSPFYSLTGGQNSINEMIRRGSIAPASASRVDGDLYMMVSANEEGEAGLVDTGIFVVQKFMQQVNKPRIPLEVFYVQCGTIYQAPGLGRLIERHLETGIKHFDSMLDSLRAVFLKNNHVEK
jgi:hypothetical protein